MATITNSIPQPYLPADVLKGRAIGALVCGGFGALWIFQAVYAGGIATPVWITLATVLSALFVLWPIWQLWSLRRLKYSTIDGKGWSAVAPAYWTIVAIEWLATIIAANWLGRTGHGNLVPQLIGAIVGVHFWPLAKLFKARIYYWTGAVMLLGALASLAIPAGSVRNLVVCGTGGYALWATAAVTLSKNRTPRQSGAV